MVRHAKKKKKKASSIFSGPSTDHGLATNKKQKANSQPQQISLPLPFPSGSPLHPSCLFSALTLLFLFFSNPLQQGRQLWLQDPPYSLKENVPREIINLFTYPNMLYPSLNVLFALKVSVF